MTPQDIDTVMAIEHVSFSAPWSARAYEYELRYNEMAHYFVARPQGEVMFTDSDAASAGAVSTSSWWKRLFGKPFVAAAATPPSPAPIVGYGGFWQLIDEAHISTIAAHPNWRRRGVGELLLIAMIDTAMEIDANVVTLEVRVSNTGAQALYRKYQFDVVGKRKGYYSDNGEDAYIMTTPSVTTAQYQREFQDLKAKLFARLSH